MTSKLKTDVLETVSGSGTIALTNQLSGMTSASLPSGSVLQVIETTTPTGTALVATSSTTYVTTGLTKTITPSATTSNIKIDVSFMADVDTTGASVYFVIKRGSTSLGSGSKDANTGIALVSNGRLLTGLSFSYLDNPSTTSATTYTLYMKTTNSGYTVRYRPDQLMSTLILTEIQG